MFKHYKIFEDYKRFQNDLFRSKFDYELLLTFEHFLTFLILSKHASMKNKIPNQRELMTKSFIGNRDLI